MGKTNQSKHDQKTLFWTIVGSVAGIAGAYFAYRQLIQPPQPPPTIQNIFAPTNVVNASGANNNMIVPAHSPSPFTPTNPPEPQPDRKLSALTEAEQQLLEQTQQEGEIKLLLAPFLITSDPAKKPSYAMLKPMLKPDTAGLDKIYLYLRQTNSAGGPWIGAAPPRTSYRGVAPGTLVTDWSDDEPTKQLLTERQQVLLKYVPVLLKAGKLGP